MKKRQVMLVAALSVTVHVAVAAQECSSGQRRLKDGEPCIPEPLFNYLYCLTTSGGGVVEVSRGSNDANSKARDIKVGVNGSGVILKGGAEVGFKQEDLKAATRELQMKLSPDLANICKNIADQVTGAPPARRTEDKPNPIKPDEPKPSAAPRKISLDNTTFSGFSCDVSSYGGEWARTSRERIKAELYSRYGCTAAPDAHWKPGYGADHRSASDGPYQGFAAQSTVLYYDSSNQAKANALAGDLTKRYGQKFIAAKGGGQGILPQWYSRTIIVHLRETGY